MNNEIPTFTPPTAPTFTPPEETTRRRSGNTCYYHENEEAVAKCARCGKPICQDCYDNYGVTSGEYEGKALCYDCCKELVAENVKQLKKNKLKIAFTFIFTLLGMLIGGILGYAFTGGGVEGVPAGNTTLFVAVYACIGGCFWTFIKCWFIRIYRTCKGSDNWIISLAIGIVVGCIIEVVLSIYRTIRKLIECIIYLVKTSGFIKSDTRALEQMNEYMEYTIVRSRNVGVDLATLMSEGSELYNNSYAQSVATNGEEKAEAMLRNAVTTINENGEIIRNFAA